MRLRTVLTSGIVAAAVIVTMRYGSAVIAQAQTIIGHFDIVAGKSYGQVRLQGADGPYAQAQFSSNTGALLTGVTTNQYGGAIDVAAQGHGDLSASSVTVSNLTGVVCDNNPSVGPTHLGSFASVPVFTGVFGIGVPTGTYVQTCTSSTSLTLSQAATRSQSSAPLIFTQIAYSDFDTTNVGTWWGKGFFAVGSPYWLRNGGTGTCGGDHGERWCVPFSVAEVGFGHYKAARIANESTLSDGVSATSGLLISMEEAQGSNDTIGVEIVGGNGATHNYLLYGADHTGAYRFSVNADRGGELAMSGITYSALDGPSNGAVVYCTNCQNTSGAGTACTSGGSGDFAFRVNGGWLCL